MGSKSRETIYGSSVRAAAERAAEARKQADPLACEAWNKRMLAFQGPAQPSPALGDALNAGYAYLEVKCLGLRDASDRRAGHRAAAEDDADPRAGAVHVLQVTARSCAAIRTSAAIWWHLVRRTKFRRVIRRQLGENGKSKRSAFVIAAGWIVITIVLTAGVAIQQLLGCQIMP